MVIFPCLFRPPVFLMVVNKDFSGMLVVISSKEGASLCRVPAVIGFNFFSAIAQKLDVAIKVNYFACGQGNNGLLVAGLAACQYTGFCVTGLFLTHHHHGVYACYVYGVLFFYGLLDLHLVRIECDDETVFSLLIQSRDLFRY